MQIRVKVSADEDQDLVKVFMNDYVPYIIKLCFNDVVNKKKLARFDEEFDINSYKALSYAVNHLIVTEVRGNDYTIKFDKSLKYNNKPIMYYINIVTYGNREIKGYTVLLDIFNEVSKNIYDLYNTWTMGITI